MGFFDRVNKVWSGLDFWDKDENERQKQQALLRDTQAQKALQEKKSELAKQGVRKPRQSTANKVRDIFDANTDADKYRRQLAGRPASFTQEQEQIRRNNIQSTATNPFKRIGEEVTEAPRRLAIGLFGGKTRDEASKALLREQEYASNNIIKAQRKLRDPNVSMDEKMRWYNYLIKEYANTGQRDAQIRTELERFTRDVDPIAGAAAVGEMGLDIATLGVGGVVLKGTKSAAKQGSKELSRYLTKNAFKPVAAGAASGATGVVTSQGSETTPGQIATGALAGAGLATLFPALGVVWDRIAKLGGDPDATISAITRAATKEEIEQLADKELGIKISNEAAEALANTEDDVLIKSILDSEAKASDTLSDDVAKTLDNNTDTEITKLYSKSQDTPVAPGKVRVYQALDADGTTQWVFTDIDSLAKYKNNTTTANTRFRFTDVDRNQLEDTARGANVKTLKDPENTEFTDTVTELTDQQKVELDQIAREAGFKNHQDLLRADKPKGASDISTTIDPNDPFENQNIFKQGINEVSRGLVDEDSELIKVLKKLDKEDNGNRVRDFYYNAHNVRSSRAASNADITRSPELKEAFGDLTSKQLKEFDKYAAARAELSNYKGLKTSKAQAELKRIVKEGSELFDTRYKALNRHYQLKAGQMFEAGLVDAKTLKNWLKNPDYIRIQRNMEDLLNPGNRMSRSRSLASTSAKQRRKGSSREILDTSKTTLKRTQEIDLEIQRNKAASQIIDTLEEAGIAEKVTRGEGKNTISRFVNGKKEMFSVPKDIKRVVENINPYHLGVIQQIVSAPARLLRAGTTALSAPFTVTNYLRDQLQSGIYSDAVLKTHSPKNIVAGIGQAVKDYVGAENSELWAKFERVAGDQTIFDELRNAKSSRKMLRELRMGGTGRAINVVSSPIRTIEDLVGITEKATRFQNFKGKYEQILKKTGNEELAIREATIAALQNSVDFQRAGTLGRQINMLIPYFNAGIQGSRNVARSFRDRPLTTTMKSIGTVALPTVSLTAYNMASADRREIYNSINEFEKQNNFIVITPAARQKEDGGWEGIIKIPKPQGYRELTDPARLITEKFLGSEDPLVAAEIAKDMAGALTGPINIDDQNKLLGSVTPQIAKPYLQQKLNKDLYSGASIVPEYMRDETDDPTKRAYEDTSGTARAIAEVLGVEPLRVEKYITDTFGSVGRYGLNASDNILAEAGKIPDNQIGGRSIKSDFSRRLFEASGSKLDKNKTEGQKYYENVKEVTANLTAEQKKVWDTLHPKKTNFLGETMFDENKRLMRYQEAGSYLQNPALIEAERELNRKNAENGNPLNPMWELPDYQLNKVLLKRAMAPGSEDEELSNLWDEEWYQEYQAANDEYYALVKQRLAEQGKKFPKQENPYPEAPQDLLDAQNTYFDLPSGTGQRSAWIQQNGEMFQRMKAFWQLKGEWEDKERLRIGLDPINGSYDADGNYVPKGEKSPYVNGGFGFGNGGGSAIGSANITNMLGQKGKDIRNIQAKQVAKQPTPYIASGQKPRKVNIKSLGLPNTLPTFDSTKGRG